MRWVWRLALAAVPAALLYFGTAFIVIQPIGALPDGATLWVVRQPWMRFVDGPDAMCQRAQGGGSLLCRGLMIGQLGKADLKIIVRLPFSAYLYLWSTGNMVYDR